VRYSCRTPGSSPYLTERGSPSMPQRIDWPKILSIVIGALAMVMGVYHLVYTRWLLQDPLMHQNTHLIFALLLVFLTTLRKKPKWWPYFFLLIALAFVSVIYIFVNYIELAEKVGLPDTIDIVIGTILVIVVLEACRQSFGWIVPAIAVILIGYALLSPYLPPPFFHTEISYGRIISWSSIGFRGIYGMFLNVSATYIILFVLFGGLLQATGVSESFMQIGKAAGKKLKSGPGQTAVVSSGLIGMVMGAGVANVALTGPITIPVMKKAGYTPNQASAIEASASAGGQIMPPVMASAAFLMAGLLGITYGSIIFMAVIPGVIYFLSIGSAVHLLALKQGITTVEEKIDLGIIKRRFPVFVIPLCVIIALLSMNYSPALAAFSAIMCLLLLSSIRKETRLNWSRLVEGFRTGCVTASGLAIAIATIGIISSMVRLTGVGMEVALTVEKWSMGIPFIAIFVCMWATILLGCGMPVVAAYALVAIVVAPVLIRMGIPDIQTHFFILYFAAFSTLSPPVASAALIGSKIAGGSYFKTAIEAIKIAAPAFIIPWIILYNPNLIAHFSSPFGAIATVLATLISILSLQAGVFGQLLTRLSAMERIAFLFAFAILIAYIVTQNTMFLSIGLVIFIAMLLEQFKKVRSRKAEQLV